jgi:hypothetical protein
MGILPDDLSKENIARILSRPDTGPLDPNDPLILAATERGQRLAFEAQRVELAGILTDFLYNEIRLETDFAYGTENTRTCYKSDFKSFKEWCAENALPFLPTCPEVVAHFLIEAAAHGVRPKKLERTVAAIAFYHEWADKPFRSNDVLIRAALRWIRRALDRERAAKEEDKPPPEPAKANGSGLH